MRLFELGAEYADLQARAEDGEDVGVALEQLSGALERKAEAIVCVLRDMELDVEKLSQEISRLSARKRTLDGNMMRAREYLRAGMLATNTTRIKAKTFSISLSDGPDRVVVEDESAIPEAFQRVKREVDKSKILDAYKADGELVRGTRIERGTRLVIR